MRRGKLMGLALALLLLALACGVLPSVGGDSGDADAVVGDGVQIEIVNRSPDEICYVLISPSSADVWGEDQLGRNETIAPGGNRLFLMDEDVYDVRVETCDEAAMATAWEVDVDITLTVGAAGADSRLSVSNDSALVACYMLISSTDADEWGEDWLGDLETLPPGLHRVFYVVPGVYDLQARDCDGEVLVEEYNVDLTEDLAWTLHD